VLSARVAAAVRAHVAPDEHPLWCLRGDLSHSLITLDDRLLIVKPGFHAGTTFGSLATTIFYRDVTGIQVHSFLVAAWIEVSSPSFQGRERKHNRHPRVSDRDVYKLPNCIPIQKRRLRECQVVLAQVRASIRAARAPATAQAQPGWSPMVDELVRLSGLRDEGAISEQEFDGAKALLFERLAAPPREAA
jgi:hypothetical protein